MSATPLSPPAPHAPAATAHPRLPFEDDPRDPAAISEAAYRVAIAERWLRRCVYRLKMALEGR